jgi:hypothetical protein
VADADVVLFVLQYPHVIQTVLQKVVLQQEKGTLPVLKRRQRTAFPPNYIHSLDSTHMMMTALACKQEGTCCRQSTGTQKRLQSANFNGWPTAKEAAVVDIA